MRGAERLRLEFGREARKASEARLGTSKAGHTHLLKPMYMNSKYMCAGCRIIERTTAERMTAGINTTNKPINNELVELVK